MTDHVLNPKFCRDLLDSFPDAPWSWIACSDFVPSGVRGRREYRSLLDYRDVAGNYAFLLPRRLFQKHHEIALKGASKREIPYRFVPRLHPDVDGMMVVYAGKATDLNKRLRQHFQGGKPTTANQVKRGLVDSKVSRRFSDATDLMFTHGVILLCKLERDKNVANRDLLELMMCSEYAAPFNIKSEH